MPAVDKAPKNFDPLEPVLQSILMMHEDTQLFINTLTIFRPSLSILGVWTLIYWLITLFIPNCNQYDFSRQSGYHSKFGKPPHRKRILPPRLNGRNSTGQAEGTERHRVTTKRAFLCEPL
ncbi:hypothetical protein [Desulfonatronospira sp. MSAO_Bac3]|uniref:hypothetical protein n=1 Tax=Desulfonatronospira sp. MSAO_Bac3 TaxID=2293857 RepID=UPI000FF0EBAB|nr:hypothetical protein [Desulfonatronospira sp. MSAO_Bac3]RQD74974.1 MAG: hypothetical protein D5S03_09240 [Desulfonatronospira sp. MSAO_Bac3]